MERAFASGVSTLDELSIFTSNLFERGLCRPVEKVLLCRVLLSAIDGHSAKMMEEKTALCVTETLFRYSKEDEYDSVLLECISPLLLPVWTSWRRPLRTVSLIVGVLKNLSLNPLNVPLLVEAGTVKYVTGMVRDSLSEKCPPCFTEETRLKLEMELFSLLRNISVVRSESDCFRGARTVDVAAEVMEKRCDHPGLMMNVCRFLRSVIVSFSLFLSSSLSLSLSLSLRLLYFSVSLHSLSLSLTPLHHTHTTPHNPTPQ